MPDAVAGRATVCRRLAMVDVECVARGHLTGSALADYRSTGAVCGVELPGGLEDGDRLAAPVFTPATKAPAGQHDENTTFAEVATRLGAPLAERLRDVTLAVYRRASALAAERGAVLVDTKLELGLADLSADGADGADPSTLTVGDELLTPDSSRFWPVEDARPRRRPQQAARARLADLAGLGVGPPRRRPAPAAARRRGRGHPGALRRGLRAAHRPVLGVSGTGRAAAASAGAARGVQGPARRTWWAEPGPQESGAVAFGGGPGVGFPVLVRWLTCCGAR